MGQTVLYLYHEREVNNMKTVRLELRSKTNRIAFGRTMSYYESHYEIGDVVKRFFELANNWLTDDQIAKLNLVIYPM